MNKKITIKEFNAKCDEVEDILSDPHILTKDEEFIKKFIHDLSKHYQFKKEK